jgi:hypothetical protein
VVQRGKGSNWRRPTRSKENAMIMVMLVCIAISGELFGKKPSGV